MRAVSGKTVGNRCVPPLRASGGQFRGFSLKSAMRFPGLSPVGTVTYLARNLRPERRAHFAGWTSSGTILENGDPQSAPAVA